LMGKPVADAQREFFDIHREQNGELNEGLTIGHRLSNLGAGPNPV
jgi:hypothetical protein